MKKYLINTRYEYQFVYYAGLLFYDLPFKNDFEVNF